MRIHSEFHEVFQAFWKNAAAKSKASSLRKKGEAFPLRVGNLRGLMDQLDNMTLAEVADQDFVDFVAAFDHSWLKSFAWVWSCLD